MCNVGSIMGGCYLEWWVLSEKKQGGGVGCGHA